MDPQSTRHPQEGTPQVLVIDDDRMSQMMLVRNLRQAGYDVESANDGADGLSKMREKAYDLVILDYLMPNMDGYEVLGEITADATLKQVPVVVVSGIGDVTNAATLIEAGAADYLTKPVDSGLLRARVSRCIDAKRMREREQRLYAELRELQALRDSLTHMIVHDLRTPLTSLLASLKTVVQMGDEMSAERKARLLGLAVNGGEALVGMIGDMLDVNKLEGGGDLVTPAQADLVAVAREAEAQVAALAEKSGVTLALAALPDVRPFSFDAAKLLRVLVNLLGNAVKATDAGGSVTIGIAPLGAHGGARLEVRDTGVGIAPEHLEHVFEKFYRVDLAGKPNRVSTGLGLTFCKMIVEAHGGTIGAQSAKGQGTTIWLELPAR